MSLRSRSVAPPARRGSNDAPAMSFAKLSINENKHARAIGVHDGAGPSQSSDAMVVDEGAGGGGGGGGGWKSPDDLWQDKATLEKMVSIVRSLTTVNKDLPDVEYMERLVQRAVKHDVFSVLPPSVNRVDTQLRRWRFKFQKAYRKMINHEAVNEAYQMPTKTAGPRQVPDVASVYRWATALSCANVADSLDLSDAARTTVLKPAPSTAELAAIVERNDEQVAEGRRLFEDAISIYSVVRADLDHLPDDTVALSANGATKEEKRDQYLCHVDNLYLSSRIENAVLRDRDVIVKSLTAALNAFKDDSDGDGEAGASDSQMGSSEDKKDETINAEIRELVMRHALLQYFMLEEVLPPSTEEIDGQVVERKELYEGAEWIDGLLKVEDYYTGDALNKTDDRGYHKPGQKFLEETILTMRPHPDEYTGEQPKSRLGSEVCAIYIRAMIDLLKVPDDVEQENVHSVPTGPRRQWTDQVFENHQPRGRGGVTLLGRRELHLDCMNDFVAAIQYRWKQKPANESVADEWRRDKVNYEYGWFGTSAMSMYTLGCLLQRLLHKNPKVAAAIEASQRAAPPPDVDVARSNDDRRAVLDAMQSPQNEQLAKAAENSWPRMLEGMQSVDASEVRAPPNVEASPSASRTRGKMAAKAAADATAKATAKAAAGADEAPESAPPPSGEGARMSTHGHAVRSEATALRNIQCADTLQAAEMHKGITAYGEQVAALEEKMNAMKATLAQFDAGKRATPNGVGALARKVGQLTGQIKAISLQVEQTAQAVQRPANARAETGRAMTGGRTEHSDHAEELSEKTLECVAKARALAGVAFERFQQEHGFREAFARERRAEEKAEKAAERAAKAAADATAKAATKAAAEAKTAEAEARKAEAEARQAEAEARKAEAEAKKAEKRRAAEEEKAEKRKAAEEKKAAEKAAKEAAEAAAKAEKAAAEAEKAAAEAAAEAAEKAERAAEKAAEEEKARDEAIAAGDPLLTQVQADVDTIIDLLSAVRSLDDAALTGIPKRVWARSLRDLRGKLEVAYRLREEAQQVFMNDPPVPDVWLSKLQEFQAQSSENVRLARVQHKNAMNVAEDLTVHSEDSEDVRSDKMARLEHRKHLEKVERQRMEDERDAMADKWLRDTLAGLQQFCSKGLRNMCKRLEEVSLRDATRGIEHAVMAARQQGGFFTALSKLSKRVFEKVYGFVTWSNVKMFVVATGTYNATASYWGTVLTLGAWMMGKDRLGLASRGVRRAFSSYVEKRPWLQRALAHVGTFGTAAASVASGAVTVVRTVARFVGYGNEPVGIGAISAYFLGSGILAKTLGFAAMFFGSVMRALVAQNIALTLSDILYHLTVWPLLGLFTTSAKFAYGPFAAIHSAFKVGIAAAGLLQAGVAWTAKGATQVFASVAAALGVPQTALVLGFLAALSAGGYYLFKKPRAEAPAPAPAGADSSKRRRDAGGDPSDEDARETTRRKTAAEVLLAIHQDSAEGGAMQMGASPVRYKAVRFPSDRLPSDSASSGGSGAWHRREFFVLAAVGTGASALLLADA